MRDGDINKICRLTERGYNNHVETLRAQNIEGSENCQYPHGKGYRKAKDQQGSQADSGPVIGVYGSVEKPRFQLRYNAQPLARRSIFSPKV